MNEQKIKELYWELYEQYHTLKDQEKKQEESISNKLNDELNEMGELLVKLKKKATKENIDLSKVNDVTYIVNSEDDWDQIIDCSESDDTIRNKLKGHIISLGKYPSAAETLEMVNIIDAYYIANVATPNPTRMSKLYLKKYGKPIEDLVEGQILYQKSAYAAILNGIEKIDTTWIIDPKVHFHIDFSLFFTKKAALPLDVLAKNIPLQLKIDLENGEWGSVQKLGFLMCTQPTWQASVKISYSETAHQGKFVNEKLWGTWVNSSLQTIRTTATLERVIGGLKLKPATTTLFSKGLEIPFPKIGGSLVLKSEFGKVDWCKLAEEGTAKFDLFGDGIAIRFQGNFDLRKFVLIDNLVSYIDIERAILSFSVGFNIHMDKAKYLEHKKAEDKKKAEKKAKQKEAKEKSDAIERENNAKKDIDNKKLKLVNKAGELKGPMNNLDTLNNKKERANFKRLVDDFKKQSDNLQKYLTDKSKPVRELAEKALKEAAEKAVRIIGKETMKKAGLLIARAVPGVGAVLTVIEVAGFLYDVWDYFNKSNMEWEDTLIDSLHKLRNG